MWQQVARVLAHQHQGPRLVFVDCCHLCDDLVRVVNGPLSGYILWHVVQQHPRVLGTFLLLELCGPIAQHVRLQQRQEVANHVLFKMQQFVEVLLGQARDQRWRQLHLGVDRLELLQAQIALSERLRSFACDGPHGRLPCSVHAHHGFQLARTQRAQHHHQHLGWQGDATEDRGAVWVEVGGGEQHGLVDGALAHARLLTGVLAFHGEQLDAVVTHERCLLCRQPGPANLCELRKGLLDRCQQAVDVGTPVAWRRTLLLAGGRLSCAGFRLAWTLAERARRGHGG
mmetsp:Transcript_747/g.1143  ORF Transcript_747/g.1143 Transcript_747/m.1143 type:complete len:285 (+) Transcript_747:358-1212(+)